MSPTSDTPDTLDFCCGKKKCPKLTDDGETIVIEDPDQSASPIRLSHEEISRVIPWLTARLAMKGP